MSDNALRVLGPQVLGAVVRRGNEFAAAEDAVQEAMLEAHRCWTGAPPDDPKGWLLTVATRKLIDAHRSDVARRRREDVAFREREAGHHRLDGVRAHLHEKAGYLHMAAEHYARAAAATRSTAERDHLTKQAARLHGASR